MRPLLPKLFTALVLVAFAGLSSGCGGGNRPFGKGSNAIAAGLYEKAPPVAMLAAKGVPDGRRAELQKYVAVEAKRRGFAVNSKANQRGYRMNGHLSAERSPRGTIVVYVWDVTDPIGSGQHRIAGQEIIPASAEGEDPWELVDDTAMSRIAARTAESLAAYLGQKGYFVRHVALDPPEDSRAGASVQTANAGAPATTASTGTQDAAARTASSVRSRPVSRASARINNQRPIAISDVAGVDKTSSKHLVEAMGIALDRRGVTVGANPEQKVLKVAGDISVGSKVSGQQTVSVKWSVLDAQGKLVGTVKQNNKVPAGTLDAGWGPIAQVVADAAAGGIIELLAKAR